jgi:hypothetical protein
LAPRLTRGEDVLPGGEPGAEGVHLGCKK